MLYQKINHCRICGNKNLVPILDLGEQALTGVFPQVDEAVESGPLAIVKCFHEDASQHCGLVQLQHDYSMEKLYGDNYGYRSGLNSSMVAHLAEIVVKIEKRMELKDGDLVIDIASNDGTLLSQYGNRKLDLLGIDPTAEKFQEYYPADVNKEASFFSAAVVKKLKGDKKAKVISSIAMFYDLPDPLATMKDIAAVLDEEGIWVVEQSYLPAMIDNVSYDTICHEHLEFYALKQFQWMAERAGLKIIDLEFNKINGASFCLTLAHRDSKHQEAEALIKNTLEEEERRGFNQMAVYENFRLQTEKHRQELKKLLADLKKEGHKVYGYGASTKGNVILQYCQLSAEDLTCIADVNEYKFQRRTPGTLIPIVSEKEAKETKPDYFLVLPWHFQDNIISREQEFLKNGGKLIFPLPTIKIIGQEDLLKKKKAVIIGVGGQDGKILFDDLSAQDYKIVGIGKDSLYTRETNWQQKIDINNEQEVNTLLKEWQPDEIYYLAAFHHSSQDRDKKEDGKVTQSYQTNVLSFLNFLEGVRLFSPASRIFYASSSLIFGDNSEDFQTEKTPCNPNTVYGLTKMNGFWLSKFYREKYGLFATAGILYNHESEYRSESFVSMKIIKGALDIKNGKSDQLILGDLNAKVDWGYAYDYVRAMQLILRTEKADDFIIATGQAHSVQDFVSITFNYLDLDWPKFVQENKGMLSPQKTFLVGDASKLKTATGWEPSLNFQQMIEKIIDDLK